MGESAAAQRIAGVPWWPPASPHKPHAAARQPAASEPGPSTPPPAKRSKRTKAEQAAEPTQPAKRKGKGKGKAAKAKPAPQPGRWLDSDCNAALIMQRIRESSIFPLVAASGHYWSGSNGGPSEGQGAVYLQIPSNELKCDMTRQVKHWRSYSARQAAAMEQPTVKPESAAVYSEVRPFGGQTPLYKSMQEYANKPEVQQLLQQLTSDMFTERPEDPLTFIGLWVEKAKAQGNMPHNVAH
ncbi:hypothetical protein QJQ45_018492 [Haematococcus lacustris]|nr:hypothetical protein QJQ45_018492 [Haematococcus lacustris]